MAVKLDRVVPWGRSLDEYKAMFQLGDEILSQKILGCGDGPASFNHELNILGAEVVSFDPIYAFSKDEIQQRFDESVDDVIQQVIATPDRWVWKYHSGPEGLKKHRINVFKLFLESYDTGIATGRYIVGELPVITAEDRSFDLALCSHFLFLYSDHFSQQFHIDSVLEMCRVAQEVRIFPLLTLAQETSPYLEPVCEALTEQGICWEIIKVDYELQKGGNRMLKITT